MFGRKRKVEALADAGASGPSGEKPKVSAGRRRAGKALVVAAVIPAAITSGWGMWTTISDIVGATADTPKTELVLPIFLLFDLAALACAVNARINRISYGRMGIEGWLVWTFAVLSGLMSMSEGVTGKEKALRFAAPIVAAVLFELLIRGERKDATGELGVAEILIRRWKARLGLGQPDQTEQEMERAAVSGRLATLAYRMHQLPENSWRRRRATGRYHRKLRAANERYGFAADPDMVLATRRHLAALYQSVTGTSEAAVADLNLWQAADRGVTGQSGAGSDREAVREVGREVTGQAGSGQVGQLTGQMPVTIDPVPGVAPLTEFAGSAGPVGNAPSNGQRSDEEILAEHGDALRASGLPVKPGAIRRITGVGGGRAAKLAEKINADV